MIRQQPYLDELDLDRETAALIRSPGLDGFIVPPSWWNPLYYPLILLWPRCDDRVPRELQQLFGDPEVLLGAVRSPEQERLRPRLDALVAVIVGFVDHTVDQAAGHVMSSGGRIAEAVRRRRLEAGSDDVFLERLLGLSLTRAQVDRGVAFVEGVIEREGEAGLARLWRSARALPTPAEVDAPGLWLARLEVDDGLD